MRGNPTDESAPKKAYATCQSRGTLNLSAFAEHITSHGCVYSKGDILAILTMAVSCIREQALAGYAVELGDLGKFYVTLTSKGADDFEKFLPQSNIKKVSVRWQPGRDLGNLKQVASFERVLPTKEADEAKKKKYGA